MARLGYSSDDQVRIQLGEHIKAERVGDKIQLNNYLQKLKKKSVHFLRCRICHDFAIQARVTVAQARERLSHEGIMPILALYVPCLIRGPLVHRCMRFLADHDRGYHRNAAKRRDRYRKAVNERSKSRPC